MLKIRGTLRGTMCLKFITEICLHAFPYMILFKSWPV